jgi:dGTPase
MQQKDSQQQALIPLQEAWTVRQNQEQKTRQNDHRDPYQRDRARVLHSAAFRRLQAKTQVHGAGSNDFHRTRLTHSLEAAQIGSGILAQLQSKHPTLGAWLPSDSLIEALCLAHDIGHPPFGHGGEIALNYMMRDHGGFEGNAQTFRIVNHLEPYTKSNGMNLSRRSVLGLVKYPTLLSRVHKQERHREIDNPRQLKAADWSPAKGIYDCDVIDWQWVIEPLSSNDKQRISSLIPAIAPTAHAKTRYKSLDCSIMELADDIAYGVHDLEDAIVLGKVHKHQWMENGASRLAECGDPWFEKNISQLSEQLFSGEHYRRKDAIGGIVNALLTSAYITEDQQFEHPLLRLNAKLSDPLMNALTIFKQFVSQCVIQVPEVQIIEYRGQQILLELSEALITDPERLLPEATRMRWQAVSEQTPSEGMRVICDYISAMTDGYAQKLHSQLFSSSF